MKLKVNKQQLKALISEILFDREAWLPIPGHPTLLISTRGRIKTKVYFGKLRDEYVFRKLAYVRGYANIQLLYPGQKKRLVKCHRLVLLTFIGPPPPNRVVCAHGDGNPRNNNITNLRWASSKENASDRQAHGRDHSKFEEPAIVRMRNLYATGTATQAELATTFGCSPVAVHDIVTGQRYRTCGGTLSPDNTGRRGGHSPVGSAHCNAKLTEAIVIAIRRDYARGLLYRELSEKYKIGITTIGSIITRQSWKHVAGPVCEIRQKCRLTEADVIAIRLEHAAGGGNTRQLGEKVRRDSAYRVRDCGT